MAYLTSDIEDHGLIKFGCNSYGGLAIRSTHPAYSLSKLEESNNCTNISDDNLSISEDNDDENKLNIISLLSSAQKPLKKNGSLVCLFFFINLI